MDNLNNLVLEVYDGRSTTLHQDATDLLSTAKGLTFDTFFPNGRYGVLKFFLPCDITAPRPFRGGDRMVARNGLEVVYEGTIAYIGYSLSGNEGGLKVTAVGAWGGLLNKLTIDKRWADARIDTGVWVTELTTSLVETIHKFKEERRLGINLSPEAGQFLSGETHTIYYTMPTGELINRLAFAYDFSETAVVSPKTAFHNNDADNGNTYTALTNAIDGSTGTSVSVTMTTDDFLYLKVPDDMEVDGIRIDLSAANNNAATLSMQRFTGVPQTVTPVSVQHDNGGAFTILTNTFDANTGTSSTVTITKDDYLYVMASEAQIMGLRIDLGGTVNAVECNMRVQRYDATEAKWTSITPDENQTEVKGTDDMMPLAQDGKILWNPAAATSAVAVNGTTGMWWRLTFSADLTASIVINEVYILSGWESTTITDGTASGGAPLAVDGDITFTWPTDLADLRIHDETGRWLRLITSATLDAVTVREIEFIDRQAWELRVRDRTGSVDWASITATGSGTVDVNSGSFTSRQTVYLEFISRDKQLAIGNGSVYAYISGLTIYSETGNIYATEIIKDGRAAITDLNSTEILIDPDADNILSIEPFISNGRETWASIFNRAAAFGDGVAATYNQWHPFVAHSEIAPTPNGKPVLGFEQYPDLDDYDYVIRVDEENVLAPIDVELDYDRIVNWVAVRYNDGIEKGVEDTPDTSALLTDADSVTKYGERHIALDAGHTVSTNAIAMGARYLNRYKRPQLSVNGPINVVGYIRGKGGNIIPAANIVAGKRLKIENFLTDELDIVEAGLTEIIYSTSYRDESETCSLSLGRPDLAFLTPPPAASVTGPGDFFGDE